MAGAGFRRLRARLSRSAAIFVGNTTQRGPHSLRLEPSFWTAPPARETRHSLLEAMSQDLGNIAAGFSSNFAYGTLKLTANTYVELVDNAANSPGGVPNAIYVNTLNVPSGATLNLNGLHLYAQTEQISGTITGGVVSPATVEWISTTSGDWNVGSNWSTGAVPTSNENVIIDVPGATPTITISSGTQSVLSITASDPLSITGGSLIVAANSTIGGGLSMTGGTLIANGSGTLFTVTGTTTVSGASLFAENGASLTVSQLTSLTGSPNATTNLEATGSGSVLSLPEVASITEPGTCCSYIQVQALAGGDVELPALTQVGGGPVLLEGDGSGSKLNISALDHLHWHCRRQSPVHPPGQQRRNGA